MNLSKSGCALMLLLAFSGCSAKARAVVGQQGAIMVSCQVRAAQSAKLSRTNGFTKPAAVKKYSDALAKCLAGRSPKGARVTVVTGTVTKLP
jgi:hypothetical protein